MEQGLLLNRSRSHENEQDFEERRGGCIAELKEEGWNLACIGAPMVITTLAQFFVPVVSSMMVGHLGELQLSSAAIATSLTNVTGFSLLLGMASGLETLCGQAYGAQQYQELGIQAYRAILSLFIVCIPIAFIWAFMGKLLILIGQDTLISEEAGKYALYLIPALFAYAITQTMTKFLQSQSLILPMLLSSIAALCCHIPLCWFMVFKSGLSNVGAALSISISYWLNVLMLGLYIKCSDSCKATRTPFSLKAFKGINEFLRFAVPSAVMICFEWWSFELLILLSGLLPNPKLETSVLSICFNSVAFLYTIPFGLGAAASTRISNELGAGKPNKARLVVRVTLLITITEAITISTTIFALRYILGYAYSDEKQVIDYVTEMVPFVCISIIMDGLQGVLSGVARGCGWQHVGAYVNIGAFYLFGIPVAVLLAFVVHLQGKGLWIGILAGAIVQTTVLMIITFSINWQLQANKAHQRIFEE
ncbi:Multi antimicrobial extrusion protein [Dioscorea alata]|uniref:Multi antimicrobial extrusion protein n=2 Tax=Dioscorea alata TaxID=55571 RepID=A0ACB7TVB2_DIOAL|nr:Multi antimicrobial extrusion protein [Dioscorea alata]